jgi:hypothetical protein
MKKDFPAVGITDEAKSPVADDLLDGTLMH